MSYIKRTLMDHEELLYQIRPHWITFTQSIGWLLITLALLIAGQFVSVLHNHIGSLPRLYLILAAMSTCIGLICLISNLSVYLSSEYGITTKRVLMKQGLLRRSTNEIFISKVESIKVQQSILGRILNYGSLEISGTGGNHEPFIQVPRPLRFRENVQNQLDKMRGQQHTEHKSVGLQE
ncbi:MAG: hypothetical protein A3F17_03895 [Gammaproteobacteria bacterium RIFCSPHIGHO2_12_FULL_41_15]|nr:MAG: hypothetical protein A3F17_03895 [Gammaproteobacteria bacterium RIFCSPHIGHO2_12_FULL_41_15]